MHNEALAKEQLRNLDKNAKAHLSHVLRNALMLVHAAYALKGIVEK